jgi:hypothetical protein
MANAIRVGSIAGSVGWMPTPAWSLAVESAAISWPAELQYWRSLMTDHLLELEERGWQALSSPDPVSFCEEWLADDAVLIVPGMVIDRATFLKALSTEQPWADHHIEEPKAVQLTDESAAFGLPSDCTAERAARVRCPHYERVRKAS